jgi:two-component system chemotaxis sensor kinase CheA
VQGPPGGVSLGTFKRVVQAVLAAAVVGFTVAVFLLVGGIFEKFGPAVRADLEWKARRGSNELAKLADLALVLGDKAMIEQSFAEYRESEDVQALVATSSTGKVLARYGTPPDADLFGGEPRTLVATADYLTSWAPATIEGTEVGRIAIVVSLGRLHDSEQMLNRILMACGIAGLLALLGGLVSVELSTRAIQKRDAALAHYAATLETRVADRTAALATRNGEMRLVLDHVAQGLMTVDVHGVLAAERSAVVDRWFGAISAQENLPALISRTDPAAGSWCAVGLEGLRDGVLPLEMSLDQLPRRIHNGGRTLDLEYQAIHHDGALEKLLVVMTDVTAELARERLEIEQREHLSLFQRVALDRAGFVEFYEEASSIVERLVGGQLAEADQKRLIHTLKGNASIFALTSVAEVCHHIETRMADRQAGLDETDRHELRERWALVSERAAILLGKQDQRNIEVMPQELDVVLDAARGGAPVDELVRAIERWRLEPVARRFERLSEQARQLSKRLGKPEVAVDVETSDVRLDSRHWRSFWSAFVHALRNAVDHGIEAGPVRVSSGKAERGQLHLEVKRAGPELVVSLRDDGQGIDWEKVRSKAASRGLPHSTEDDLINALFEAGVSTRDEASDTSGRGEGMGALKHEVELRGGHINVASERTKGTTMEFRFPRPSLMPRTKN